MLLLLLNYVVLRALLKIDVYLISTLVNKIIIIIIHKPNMGFLNRKRNILTRLFNHAKRVSWFVEQVTYCPWI